MFSLQKNSSKKYKQELLSELESRINRLVMKNDLSTAFNRDQVINDFNYFPQYVAKSYWKTSTHIKILADELNRVEKGETTRLMVLMPPRSSKCVVGDSPILCCDNITKTINDIQVGDSVRSISSEFNITTKLVINKFSNGVRDTLEVISCSGKRVVCTANHPFLTDRGWVDAGKLIKRSDVIAVIRYNNVTWEGIASVKSCGKNEVFDIEVEDTHNFIVDGIVTHNSENVSTYFPAWYLGKNPENRVILAAYGVDLAMDFSIKARDIIREYGPELFGVELSKTKASAKAWDLKDHRGGLIAVGVGGATTGKGSNCFPKGTMVSTELGYMDIKDLVEMKNPPKVFSFNHKTGIIELKRIITSKKSKAEKLYATKTCDGNAIKSTGDHEIYTESEGYISAIKVRRGHVLFCSEIKKEHDVCSLRERQDNKRSGVSRLSRCDAEDRYRASLRVLREAVQKNPARISEGNEKRSERLLLLEAMLSKSSCCKKRKKMFSMRHPDAESKWKKVLLQRMPNKQGDETSENMPILRVGFYSSFNKNNVLLKRMRKFRTFKKNDGRGKLKLQGGGKLCEGIFGGKASCVKERYVLHYLRESGRVSERSVVRSNGDAIQSCGPSYKRKCNGQFYEKSCNNVQELSYYSSQIKRNSVCDTEEITSPNTDVFDIQVEDNHNFFANGILVHNCLIIDDPIKNHEQANSKTYRQKCYDWYKTVARTRLQPGNSAIVICLTRWHKDDLVGKLLQDANEDGEQWKVIKLPAIAGYNDIMGRAPGEPLWPEMFPLEVLLATKKAIGQYFWSALYQQEPAEEEGSFFKRAWFKYFSEEWIAGELFYCLHGPDETRRVSKKKCWIFQACDPAATEDERNDFFVLTTFAVTPQGELLVLDTFREHAETVKHKAIMKQQYHKWRPRFQAVENKTFGTNIINECKRELPVKPLDADSDKISRSHTISVKYETGMVYHRQGMTWVSELEEELTDFPVGKHDDQVDVMAYAGITLVEKTTGKKPVAVVGKAMDWGNSMYSDNRR